MASPLFGSRVPLAQIRGAKGLTPAELARMVEVDVEVIRRLEKGDAAGPVLLAKLGKALNVPGQSLLPPVNAIKRKAFR